MEESITAVLKHGIPGWERNGRFVPLMAGGEPRPGEPAVEVTPEPAAAPPASEPSGPWAQDLARSFEDPAVRGQVDDFMRRTYQPYVTGLETKAAELEQAASFVNDLRENPLETYLELTNLIGGDELLEQVQGLLSPQEQAQVVEEIASAAGQGELDPRLQEIIEERENQRALEQYEAQLAELDVDPEIFHPLVISHQGDIKKAYEAYPVYLAQVKKALGIEDDVNPNDIPDPPAVLGSDTHTATTPPLEQRPATIDDALDQFFASKAPQPVGAY